MKSSTFIGLVCALILWPYTAFTATIYVDHGGGGDYLTIQEGIDAAAVGDLVIVAPGTYLENIVFPGHAITVRSDVDGDPLTEDIAPATTIIDGNQSGSVVTFNSGETEDSVINGFTISNGDTSVFGGGISCLESSSPTIMNCIILENNTTYGGGISCLDSSSPTIMNCIISENTARDGGGISCSESSSPTIMNCIISGNNTTSLGGGIICIDSSPTIMNCIISENTTTHGGGISNRDSSSPTITNCILWNNDPDEIHVTSGTPAVTYSDIDGGWTGEGNIDMNPLFVLSGSYMLAEGSPCIDAGDMAYSYNDDCFPPSKGDERNDMGAYGGPGACIWCADHDDDGYDMCGGGDCNGIDPNTFPGAVELCDGFDNDCDNILPLDEADDDSDGYMMCEGDCDDSHGFIYPGADEVCDGYDNDCDGTPPTDEADTDQDGWRICENDCNDSDADINPTADEFCGDDVDNNCDGLTDIEDEISCPCTDIDGDGYSQEHYCGAVDCNDENNQIHPGHPEVPDNGIDDDCDGQIDEGCFVGLIMESGRDIFQRGEMK